jgi:helicase
VNCAKDELMHAIEHSGKPLGTSGRRRMLQILLKLRDFNRTIKMLSPLEADFELTRFDVVRSEHATTPVKVESLLLDARFKRLLHDGGLKTLLPVQSIAVERGALRGENLLVVSATATGKTFVGELAGIENVLKGRGKLLFLVPLVALANQKYRQFSKRYNALNLSVSLRIGVSRIKTRRMREVRTSLDSDIIVGTYEGVDYVIRSGMAEELGKIGTVVIDEVHMLEDAERGHRIDGLITRLRFLYPDAQFVYLSATVGNPRWLAKKLDARLVEYEPRPIPLERHLIFASEAEKLRLIEQLCEEEYNHTSSKGFRGQSIVFTNSRRKCEELARQLRITAAAYHAGLSYDERVRIEQRFAKGELPVVVTTAALAAGVDFPASQVIFETLSMGIDALSVQEFHQMMGRAGRPDYHDRGRVVLLADTNRRFPNGESEDEAAFKLLRGEVEHVDVVYDNSAALEQTLANVAASGRKTDLKTMDEFLLGYADREKSLEYLTSKGFLRRKKDDFTLTKFGRIVSSHFLSVSQAFLIKETVLAERDVLELVVEIEVFDAVYFNYAGQLSRTLKVEVSDRVFTAASLDVVFSPQNISKLDANLKRMILDFSVEFLNCDCRDAPFCGCSEKKFSKYLLELRCKGLEPSEIIQEISARFSIYAYEGDIINYLDSAVRLLEATTLIAEILGKKEVAEKTMKLRRCIEEGTPNNPP